MSFSVSFLIGWSLLFVVTFVVESKPCPAASTLSLTAVPSFTSSTPSSSPLIAIQSSLSSSASSSASSSSSSSSPERMATTIATTTPLPDIFWSSRDRFLAAHVGQRTFANNDYFDDGGGLEQSQFDLAESQSQQSKQQQADPDPESDLPHSDLKTADNFQFMRIPNEHQWEAEHLRGSKRHKIYHNFKIDHNLDRAESVAQWNDEDEPGDGNYQPGQRLGKQIVIWT